MKIGVNKKGEEFSFEAHQFEDYLNGIIHEWLLTLTALGLHPAPIFFLLDYFTMPPALIARLVYRLISTILALTQYFIIRNSKPSISSYYHGYFVSINVGARLR